MTLLYGSYRVRILEMLRNSRDRIFEGKAAVAGSLGEFTGLV